MAVRVDLNISLDGFATTTDQTPDDPFGQDWGRLVAAYIATRTFRARVLHDTSGAGTTGIDDQYAEEYFAEIGAKIMGAGMFGLHTIAPSDRAPGLPRAPTNHRATCPSLTNTTPPSPAGDQGSARWSGDSAPKSSAGSMTCAASTPRKRRRPKPPTPSSSRRLRKGSPALPG